jgi:branched-chain amino acid transport system permease protein
MPARYRWEGGAFSPSAATHHRIFNHLESFGVFFRSCRSVLSSAGLLVSGQNLYGDEILYLNPWAGCIAAILFSVLIAYLIGIPVLKLKGHYLVMATMSFSVVIEVIVRGTTILGGADGLSKVPPFQLLPGVRVSGDINGRVINYAIAWIIVIIGLVVLINIINSRVGRALRSLHDNEDASNSMGIDTSRYKLNVFIISAVFATVAGVFMTHFNASIGPSEASVMKSVRYASIVAIGGMANIWGTLIMGLVLFFLSLRGVFGSYDDAVFGAILILVMLFAPDGLLKKDLSTALKLPLKHMPKKGSENEDTASQ